MFIPDFCPEHVVAPRSCALFCQLDLLIPLRVLMKVPSLPAIQPESSTKYLIKLEVMLVAAFQTRAIDRFFQL